MWGDGSSRRWEGAATGPALRYPLGLVTLRPHGSLALALALACAPRLSAAQRRPTAPEDDFATPGLGRVALAFQSPLPQTLALMRPHAPDPDHPERRWSGSATCTTPCRVYVPPGPLHLRTTGPGLRPAEFDLTVPEGPATITLRAGSSRLFNVGTGLVAAGTMTFLAAAVVGLVRQNSAAPDEQALPTAALIPIGSLLLGLFGVGVPLMVLHRTGVDHLGPLSPEGAIPQP